MNQMYAEAGAKRKNTPAIMGLRALYMFGIFAGVIVLFLGSIFSVVGAAMIVFIIYMFPRLNVEFEYVYCDGQIDFDKIMGKAKRKNILRIDFEQVEIMAPVNSHAFDGYTYIKDIVVKDFSSGNKESKPYALIVSKGAQKTKIIFEPNEKMLACIKQKSPRKIAQC